MTLPFVNVSEVSSALSTLPPDTDGLCCVVGASSLLAPNVMYAFRTVPKLTAIAGQGPGVEAAAAQIAQNGSVYLCSPTSDVAGVLGAFTQTGSSPTVTGSGTPTDDFRIRGTITKGGEIGVAQVAISVDGGNTYAAPVAIAASLPLANTGVTLAFPYGISMSAVASAGTSPPVMTITGTPIEDVNLKVRINTIGTGALGSTTVDISIDGGTTWPQMGITSAATIVVTGTGLTLHLAVGPYSATNVYTATSTDVAYNANDGFSADCQAPYFSPTNFTAAGAAIMADPAKREFGTMLIAGKAQGATDTAKATAWTAMIVAAGAYRLDAFTNKRRPFRVVVEAPDVAATALEIAVATTTDSGVLPCAAFMDVQSPITQLIHKRPGGGEYCARIGSISVQKHPGEVRQGQGGGPLPSRVRAIYFTESDVTDLDSARIITVRTLVGSTGFFFSRGPTLDVTGGDYAEHQFCRVADLASKISRNVLQNWLNSDLALKRDGSGTLSDSQADVIDSDMTSQLRTALVNRGYVVDAAGKVDRTINVRDTSSLEGDTSIQRRGYANFITWRVGFARLT